MSDKPERQNPLDSVVADILGGMERAAEERQLPRKEREKKRKAREKLAARNRLMIDLPEDINRRIEAIAAAEGVSVSGVIALACWRLIRDQAAGRVEWTREPSRSPRFAWRVMGPPILE